MNPYESPKHPEPLNVNEMSESEIEEFIQPICRRASRLLLILGYTTPPNTFLRSFGIWIIRRWFPVEWRAIELTEQNESATKGEG